jgi:hypothetical protein
MSRRKNNLYQDEDVFSDEDDSFVGSEMEEEEEMHFEENAPAKVQAENDPHKGTHVVPEMYRKPQTVIMDISFNASPEELAAGDVDCDWRLEDHLPKYLKQNVADKNRSQATDDQLKGNLRRAVPIQLEILRDHNTMPFPMHITAPGMANGSMSKHGPSLWYTEAKTVSQPVKEFVFVPENIIDKYMVKNNMNMNPDDLDSFIQLHEGKKIATVAVHSPAYDKLVTNLRAGKWQEHDLDEHQWNSIMEPGPRQTLVEVPYAIGKTLYDNMVEPIKDFTDRCIDLENFYVRASRADNQPWNSRNNLVGETIGSDLDPDHALPSEALTTRQVYHVKARLTYAFAD